MAVIGTFAVPHPPLILPEVGRGEEKGIQNTIDAYRQVARRIAELKPDTVVVTSTHSVMYSDYFHISPGKKARGDLRRFGAPSASVEVEYDREFASGLAEKAKAEELAAGLLGEREKELDHGTIIPLRFLKPFNLDYRLVRIGLSGLPFIDHYRLGKLIARTAEDLGRRIVLIASGDLSHKLTEDGPYGYAEEGPEFDRRVTEALGEGDFLALLSFSPDFCELAAECGLRSFIIMAGALDGKAVKPELLSYEGPFGVGYAVAAFEITGDDPKRRFEQPYLEQNRKRLEKVRASEDPYVRLARLSLETYVRTGKPAKLPDDLPAEMLGRRAGVFVSIKKDGQLRGCIGTISPATSSIAEEILRNAISSGTEDPRFDRVQEPELDELVYSVDVLSEPEPISSVDELDVKRYGVIVSKGFRRGLLLPNLEGINDPETQVAIAKRKAGIGPDETVSLERFEVVRHQ
jgi:AmmeMemoRadiSam system protein A/AmmeMemoRadiSam system protein B